MYFLLLFNFISKLYFYNLMELMNTPIHSNKNENLIEVEQNTPQNVNINQYFTPTDAPLSEETFIIKFQNWPFIFIGAILSIFLNLAIFSSFDLYYKIFLSSVGIILLLSVLFIVVNKIIIIKDSLNKKILIKIVNYLCLTKKKLNFDLENIHFYVSSELEVSDDGDRYTNHRLFIINDYQNLVGIDLSESNIKQKPVKCIYYFRSPKLGNYNYKEFEKALNNFVGSPKNYKNPLLFDINNYLEESKKLKPAIFGTPIKFIKFSEYFFTYYPKGFKFSFKHYSTYGNCLFYFIYFVELMLIFSIFIAVLFSIEMKNFLVLLITISVCVIFNLLVYFLYKCCKSSKENILRIDFIYSKDFERIFIGVVKYTKTNYIKTLELQKNDINKFIYERVEDINFYFKVLLKNDKKEYICTLEKQREDELEGLICFLNGEFIAHTNHNVKSYEQI